MSMSMFEATINVPGYLPMADEPHLFESARDAWEFLGNEREDALDDVDYDEPEFDEDPCLEEIKGFIDHPDVGTVYGRTPGSDSDHDLGLAYSVEALVHVDYPHEPGRLYDCAVCESYCFCTSDPGHTECVYCAVVAERQAEIDQDH